ncbi:MAG TPA: 4-hydroxy-tetrahydrodipicolinate reductase [Azospirillaceae bacterium]|nr:4-hydroxy-tetrahydrodipicolinate reductase [Azospirillaceae bacterium]
MRVAVLGCAGRMGRMLVRAISEAPDGLVLAGGTVRSGGAGAGQDIGAIAGLPPLGLAATDDATALFAKADVAIDFTSPDATLAHVRLAAQAQVPMVVGTTGLDAGQRALVEQASRHVPIVLAANTSLGVTLLAALVEQAARTLDPGFDIEIVEMHHRRKVDAPSGTALALGAAAAAGRGVDPGQAAVRARDGLTGPRREGDIGYAVLRGGDVVGEHTVVFAGDGERIELTHKAGDRMVFARGALRAARWVRRQAPGLYSMRDVLGVA